MFRPNRLLAKFRAGEPCLGAWLFTGSPTVSEVLGLAGFDALIIDHEHTPGGIETAVEQIRAIQAAGPSTVLARVGSNDPARIRLLLDAGVEGLILPDVRSAEEARRFVAACRYPPAGIRGAHFTVSRAAHWGRQGERYYRDIDKELILIAMIESEAGVRAIPAMAGIDGLTMLFLGPLDLSASIGKMGMLDDPAVIGALREAESAILGHGVMLGGAALPAESAADCFARGYRFVTSGSDVGMLHAGAARLLAGAR
ncbi:HpcH/HpaI aldolase family protein [Massilia cavernae]|uniref:4-hydroxy-2-oxovalerate aldolase n=1 Tax=Massilia cavernae TaxID=2320864 RepID=A0A418XQT7_9BURK|nr:aldolase/citrate lyase family protein [Massilia cavernae]RJG14872.1 4-hydroxy-2-oxovalerate aldolase [Massilia cavernae]